MGRITIKRTRVLCTYDYACIRILHNMRALLWRVFILYYNAADIYVRIYIRDFRKFSRAAAVVSGERAGRGGKDVSKNGYDDPFRVHAHFICMIISLGCSSTVVKLALNIITARALYSNSMCIARAATPRNVIMASPVRVFPACFLCGKGPVLFV